jgi:hypothetical protein
MKMIDTLVRAHLAAQPDQEETAALWVKLWAAYENGGEAETEALLTALLTSSSEAAATEEGS